MTAVGERERRTQNDVIRFFRDELSYRYLGDWHDRQNNRCIEEDLLHEWLTWWGYDSNRINKVLRELDQAAAISGSRTLYEANRAVYEKLRYGVHIKPSVDAQTETVWLVDWDNPENNDFAVAEEVTVEGPNTKRPDVVLYVNGLALGVLELKRSTVSVTEGIRQNLDSQKPEFIQPFWLLSTRLSQKGMTAASKTASIQAPTPIPKGFVHGGNHPSEDSWPSWPVRQVRGLGRRQPVAGLSLPPRSPFCGCVAPRRSALHGQSVAATAGTGFAPMRVSRDA